MTAYDAFISYGQDADGELAEALQVGLQRLAKPWRKRRAMEVFRDATGLSASPDLRGTLLSSLTGSRFLVLLASPDAAASPWVNEELTTFTAQDELAWQRVIIVLTDGEWKWAGDGTYTPESTAVPKALVGVFRTEPLYVDLRWAKEHPGLTLADAKFKAAVADIASPIRGIAEDELIGEDVRLFKQAKRLRWSAVVGLSVLLVASLIASAVAVSKGREAVQQRNAAQEQTERAVASEKVANEERDRAEEATAEAVENAAVARSGELSTAALAMVDDDPEVAAALAVESLYPNGETEMRRSPQADNAVGVTGRRLVSRVFVPSGAISEASLELPVAGDGRYLATLTIPTEVDACWPRYTDGVAEPTPITWWDRDTGTRVEGVPPGVELPVQFIVAGSNVFRIDDAHTVTPMAGTPVVVPTVLPVADGEISPPEPCPTFRSPATYDAASGTIVAFDESTSEFVATDAMSGQERSRMGRSGVTRWADVAVASGIVFAAAGDSGAAAGDSESISIWSLADGGQAPADAPFTAAWVEGADDWVVSGATVAELDLTTGGGIRPTSMQDGIDYPVAVAISPGERFVAETDGTNVQIWQLGDAVSVASWQFSTVRYLFWIGDELAVVSARGTEFYVLRDQQLLAGTSSIETSADGSVMIGLTSDSSTAQIFDASDPLAGPTRTFAVDAQFAKLAQVSADGRLALIAGAHQSVYDVASGSLLWDRDLAIAALDPAGTRLAVIHVEEAISAPTMTMEILDTNDWSVVASVAGLDAGAVRSIVWWSSQRLLVVSYDGDVQSVGLVGDRWVVDGSDWPNAPGGLWVDADRGLLAVGDSTGRLGLWHVADGEAAPTLLGVVTAGTSPVTAVAFSAEPALMVAVAGGDVRIWDIADLAAPREVELLSGLPVFRYGFNTFGSTVSFGPDAHVLFIASPGAALVLPVFDPARVCAELTDDDLARAAAIIGNESACTRISELRAAD